MESVLRRFGIKKGEHRESEARLKLQKELFQFNKCSEHGFPNKPSSMAFDPKLRLLAIGTKSGALRVYGKPGVEFSGHHENDVSVTHLFFLPEQGRLVSVCSDNSLHLWEINNNKDGCSEMEEIKEFSMENIKLKTISACCVTADNGQILLGTEGGNVHTLDVNTFKLTEHVIYQEAITQNVPDDFKINPGAVESVKQHPTEAHKFLIGFNRGLIVLWDSKENNAEQTYNASQQLESLCWYRDGSQFMSAHADGSYIIWSSTDSTKPKEQATTPYGPFPCKSINKIEWKSAKVDNVIAFAGGMPRASYGDRHTVSVTQGSLHTVFDFTSRVVDFVLLNNAEELDDFQKGEYDEPHALIVLVEEELVAIDLTSGGWSAYRTPYLASLHSSAITCSHHVSNVSEALWNKIVDAGEAQMGEFSSREWPIQGGKNLHQGATSRDLLLTGHEDGSVRFWDASTTSVNLLYKLTTANLFGTDTAPADVTNIEDEEWPPFRKAGTFDPYSDDPRLGVLKIQMCALSETLVLGGTAGQVVVLQFEREEREVEVKVTPVNVVSDRDNFVWKGHEALAVRGGDVRFAPGFQPVTIMQIQPPAACTALAFHSEWQLVAAGTAHGFGVFDYVQRKEVSTKCTLNPADLTGTGESAMSRRKSFKKSLRESFRRLRNRKSDKRKKRAEKKEEESGKLEEQKPEEKKEGEAEATPATPEKTAKTEVVETESPRTVERQVESRAHVDDAMASMVRTIYFADTFLISGQSHTPTMWAGTNAGTIFVYQITIPANDKRETEDVQCVLGKEIQLKHRAPVVAMMVVDRHAQPLPAPLEVQHELAKAPDMSGNHQVVICSEEQFKIFTLPNLKANNKFKLTAHEGSKVRRVGFVNFRSRSDERYAENDLVCLTNLGELQVFTVPQLRRQLKAECIRKDNAIGINCSVFTQFGEGFYLYSPSEFARFSLSARFITKPMGLVEIKEGVRPPPPEPEPEPEVVVEAAVAEAPAETGAGDGDRAAEGETPEEGAAEGANDSVAAADTTVDTTVDSANITVDSVRVHLSEESSNVAQSSASRTVVTKTTTIAESTGDGVVTQETTTVVHTSSSESPAIVVSTGGAGDAAAAGADATNLDDDTKLTGQIDEVSEQSAAVDLTYISEEETKGEPVVHTPGEAPPPPPTDTADAQTPPLSHSQTENIQATAPEPEADQPDAVEKKESETTQQPEIAEEEVAQVETSAVQMAPPVPESDNQEVVEEPVQAAETSVSESQPTVEEPVQAAETPVSETQPTVEEPVQAAETPVSESQPTVEEPVQAAETPVSESQPTVEEPVQAAETPVSESQPTVVEEPIPEEAQVPEEKAEDAQHEDTETVVEEPVAAEATVVVESVVESQEAAPQDTDPAQPDEEKQESSETQSTQVTVDSPENKATDEEPTRDPEEPEASEAAEKPADELEADSGQPEVCAAVPEVVDTVSSDHEVSVPEQEPAEEQRPATADIEEPTFPQETEVCNDEPSVPGEESPEVMVEDSESEKPAEPSNSAQVESNGQPAGTDDTPVANEDFQDKTEVESGITPGEGPRAPEEKMDGPEEESSAYEEKTNGPEEVASLPEDGLGKVTTPVDAQPQEAQVDNGEATASQGENNPDSSAVMQDKKSSNKTDTPAEQPDAAVNGSGGETASA